MLLPEPLTFGPTTVDEPPPTPVEADPEIVMYASFQDWPSGPEDRDEVPTLTEELTPADSDPSS